MELHMVFYKEEYKSVAESVKHHDGLTVLAFFYEVNHILVDLDLHYSILITTSSVFLNKVPYLPTSYSIFKRIYSIVTVINERLHH